MNEHGPNDMTDPNDTTPCSNFLTRILAGYPCDPSLRVEMRAIRDNERHRVFYPITPDGLREVAIWAYARAPRLNVYFGVCPRLGEDGTAAGVAAALWLWADIDQGDGENWQPMELWRTSGLPEPHLIVRSGSRESRHLYWRLSEPFSLDTEAARGRFKGVLRRIALALGGTPPGCHADPACAEPARVLRLPTTLNHKHRPPTCCAALPYCPDAATPQTLDWWSAFLPAEPLPARAVQIACGDDNRSATTTHGLRSWSQHGYAEGDRHRRLTSDAAWLIRELHIAPPEALSLLSAKAAASPGRHPITDRELEGMITWASH
jgi:hypothetical protein